MDLDLRGIRNPQSPFNGRLNPTQGSPKRFVTPEHLQCIVDEYFASCYGPILDRNGNLVRDSEGNVVKVQKKPYTVSGLALYLGVSTDTLKKYTLGRIDTILDEMRAETEDVLTFARVIIEARQKIEAYAEERLYDKDGQRGAQYVLDCCYKWSTTRESADIEKAKAELELKKKEFELKRKVLDDSEEDGSLTINIIRGKKDDNE